MLHRRILLLRCWMCSCEHADGHDRFAASNGDDRRREHYQPERERSSEYGAGRNNGCGCRRWVNIHHDFGANHHCDGARLARYDHRLGPDDRNFHAILLRSLPYHLRPRPTQLLGQLQLLPGVSRRRLLLLRLRLRRDRMHTKHHNNHNRVYNSSASTATTHNEHRHPNFPDQRHTNNNPSSRSHGRPMPNQLLHVLRLLHGRRLLSRGKELWYYILPSERFYVHRDGWRYGCCADVLYNDCRKCGNARELC